MFIVNNQPLNTNCGEPVPDAVVAGLADIGRDQPPILSLTATEIDKDARVRAVLDHFEEWHGSGPDAREVAVLLSRIDATAPAAPVADAARVRWLTETDARLQSCGNRFDQSLMSELHAAIDAVIASRQQTDQR